MYKLINPYCITRIIGITLLLILINEMGRLRDNSEH